MKTVAVAALLFLVGLDAAAQTAPRRRRDRRQATTSPALTLLRSGMGISDGNVYSTRGDPVSFARASTWTVEDTVGTNVLSLPGTSGAYASTPDSAANSITGNIDIRACVTAADWSNASMEQALVAKMGTNTRAYRLSLNLTGFPNFGWAVDGTTLLSSTSGTAVPFADGFPGCVRATHAPDNGAGGRTTTFYTSADNGMSWTQLGSAIVSASSTLPISDTTAPLEVGTSFSGGSTRFTGVVHWAEIRNGIDGTVVAKFEPSKASAGASSFAAETGETWTINSPAVIAVQKVRPLATNKPALVDNTSLRVRSQVTNLALYSDQFDSAAWAKGAGGTGSTPVVTANACVAPDGTMTADRIVFNKGAGTTSADMSNLSQLISQTSGTPYVHSIWLRTESGTCDIRVEPASGVAAGTPTLTTTWQRVASNANVAGSTAVVTSALVRLRGASTPATSDSCTVCAWGSQQVATSVAGDYCLTAGTSATCATETATVPTPASLSTTEGCSRFCFAPSWTGNQPYSGSAIILSANATSTVRIAYMPAGVQQMGMYDGTTFLTTGTTFTAGVRRCYRTTWSAAANQMCVHDVTAGTSGCTVFTSMPATGPNVNIGAASGFSTSNGNLDSIVIGSTARACQ